MNLFHQSPVARSHSAPISSKGGRETTPTPASHTFFADTADESGVAEGTDVTMGTSSEGERASPAEWHTKVLPRPHADVESSEDELAGKVISEHSSISAPISDNVSLARLWVSFSDL